MVAREPNNPASSKHSPTSPPAGPSSGHRAEPQNHQAKTGIGGCLLYPLFFLSAQLFLFVHMLLTSNKSTSLGVYRVTYRIFWPYLIYDLILLGAVAILLLLFLKKKAILPAMFVFFLVSFSILSGLVTHVFWRLPEARVVGQSPLLGHFVLLFQCLLLAPYFVLDARVKNTFIHELDEHGLVDRLIKPVAAPAQRLYDWLVRRGKKVFLYTLAFVIFTFLFGWVVDSIVLNVILS